MEVEDVTGIRFTARGAAKDQRDLAIGHGVLGKIIIDDEGVHPVVHEPFTDCGTGIGSQILIGGGIGRGSDDNAGVIHGTLGLKRRDGARHVRELLPDHNVDTVKRLVVFQRAFLGSAVLTGLGNDGVDRNGGLAGGTVTDDELTLTTADRDHRIDGENAGLNRNADRLPRNDAGGDLFDRVGHGSLDFSLAIDGLTQRVNDATEHLASHGDGEEFAG